MIKLIIQQNRNIITKHWPNPSLPLHAPRLGLPPPLLPEAVHLVLPLRLPLILVLSAALPRAAITTRSLGSRIRLPRVRHTNWNKTKLPFILDTSSHQCLYLERTQCRCCRSERGRSAHSSPARSPPGFSAVRRGQGRRFRQTHCGVKEEARS